MMKIIDDHLLKYHLLTIGQIEKWSKQLKEIDLCSDFQKDIFQEKMLLFKQLLEDFFNLKEMGDFYNKKINSLYVSWCQKEPIRSQQKTD